MHGQLFGCSTASTSRHYPIFGFKEGNVSVTVVPKKDCRVADGPRDRTYICRLWGILFGSRCASGTRDMYPESHEKILSDIPLHAEAVLGPRIMVRVLEE
jgi:hypothetical protein